MVVTKRLTEQNREIRNKPTPLQTINIQQRKQAQTMGQRQFIQKMVLRKLDRQVEKNESRPPSYTTHKNIFKMDQRLKCQTQTIKILEENRQQNFGHSFIVIFYQLYLPKQGKQKKKQTNKWNYIKLKSFCIAKENIKKIKSLQIGRTYLPIHPIRGYYPKFTKYLQNSTPKKQTTQLKNGQKT